jgi:hypothetical protein
MFRIDDGVIGSQFRDLIETLKLSVIHVGRRQFEASRGLGKDGSIC